ncbi:hypothetical protein AMK06_CH00324 [Rhizobium sp. N541]|nr:hypothetical protein AMK05_CH00322 [Rhizobium sp. N324]ANM15276.1 hypothetical protein AMK06_CH00324 [Rhizobium sp. N541]ANM21664.1 hypothetical protein AMK07_CH00324 [Rhizobium sp. N941]OYD02328.1 hypothetical protein AMK08_CH100318 [Rhizobium sp. N4311]
MKCLPEDVIFAARQAAATVEGAPIAVTFDRIASFKRKRKARPLVLCSKGGLMPLVRLHVQLGVGMHNTGLREYRSQFYAAYDAAL